LFSRPHALGAKRSSEGKRMTGDDEYVEVLRGMGRSIILERLAETKLGLPARGQKRMVDLAPELVAMCEILAQAYLATGPWGVDGFDADGDGPVGPPPRPIELSVPGVSEYLREIDRRNRAGRFDIPALSAATGEETLLVLLGEVPFVSGGIANAQFVMPEREPAGGYATLMGALAQAFGAFNGRIHQEDLFNRYVTRGVEERLREVDKTLSPEHRQWSSSPSANFSDGVNLDLLHPDHLDRRLVPTGVWWTNYWNADQLRTLGEDRVRDAGWAAVLQAANGALVLSATHEPLDLRQRAHLQQLEHLVRAIGLRAAQERCRKRHPYDLT
jgi:hypothetical protein